MMKEYAAENLKFICKLSCLTGIVFYLFSSVIGYIYYDDFNAYSVEWMFGIFMTIIVLPFLCFCIFQAHRCCVIYIRWAFALYAATSLVYFTLFIANISFFLNISRNPAGIVYATASLILAAYWFVEGYLKSRRSLLASKQKIITEINKESGYVLLSEKNLKKTNRNRNILYKYSFYIYMALIFGTDLFFIKGGMSEFWNVARLYVMMILSFMLIHVSIRAFVWVLYAIIFSFQVAKETHCTPYITK